MQGTGWILQDLPEATEAREASERERIGSRGIWRLTRSPESGHGCVAHIASASPQSRMLRCEWLGACVSSFVRRITRGLVCVRTKPFQLFFSFSW